MQLPWLLNDSLPFGLAGKGTMHVGDVVDDHKLSSRLLSNKHSSGARGLCAGCGALTY
jgi:hypothetical protein